MFALGFIQRSNVLRGCFALVFRVMNQLFDHGGNQFQIIEDRLERRAKDDP